MESAKVFRSTSWERIWTQPFISWHFTADCRPQKAVFIQTNSWEGAVGFCLCMGHSDKPGLSVDSTINGVVLKPTLPIRIPFTSQFPNSLFRTACLFCLLHVCLFFLFFFFLEPQGSLLSVITFQFYWHCFKKETWIVHLLLCHWMHYSFWLFSMVCLDVKKS